MNYCQCTQESDESIAAGKTEPGFICGRCYLEKMDTNITEEAVVDPANVPATPSDKDVYLALRGSKRIKKPIKKATLEVLINSRTGMQPLLAMHGMDAILARAQEIHDSGAFKSNEKAKTLFPSLFQQEPGDGSSAVPEAEEPTHLSSMALKRVLATLETTLEHACYEFIEHNLHGTIKIVERRTTQAAGLQKIADFILSQSDTLRQQNVHDADRILEAVSRAIKPMSADIDARMLLRMLPVWERLTTLLGSSSGQKTMEEVRHTMEPILGGFLEGKKSNADQIREKGDYFAAERKKLDQLENKEVEALKEQADKIDKEVTMQIIREIRKAEDTLLLGYIEGDYSELSLQ